MYVPTYLYVQNIIIIQVSSCIWHFFIIYSFFLEYIIHLLFAKNIPIYYNNELTYNFKLCIRQPLKIQYIHVKKSELKFLQDSKIVISVYYLIIYLSSSTQLERGLVGQYSQQLKHFFSKQSKNLLACKYFPYKYPHSNQL